MMEFLGNYGIPVGLLISYRGFGSVFAVVVLTCTYHIGLCTVSSASSLARTSAPNNTSYCVRTLFRGFGSSDKFNGPNEHDNVCYIAAVNK